ncbi:MAG: hypothetical protein ABSB12_02350 [Candidatus Saccharimonadales bacterium]|jgi:hypothetical protein
MVYRYGQRVQLKNRGIKTVIFGLLGCLLISILTNTFINSQDVQLLSSSEQPQKLNTVIVSHNSPKITTFKSTGSAHQAATTGQETPSVVLPVLPSLQTQSCSLFPPPTPGLANAVSPELRKLAQYEAVCNGALAARVSFFVPTPITVSTAQSDADSVAVKLKEFASFDIDPLVFIEPVSDSGNNIDLNLYSSGTYDPALDAYFAELKADGVTDAMMGMWVVLPEGNLPVWSTTDPETFAADVTITVQFQKKYFPNSQSAILLDSESYAPGAAWGSGSYVSLLPYVQNIPKGLIDSFGLQGFPWTAPANQAVDTVYDPKIYLRDDFAAEAARALGINNIWFNTGTFNQMYTQTAAETVSLSPIQRQSMLNGVLGQAELLQAQGFNVAIHLFAQDKSATSEATDWSYWHNQPGEDANTAVFTTFVHDITTAGIPLWLFDSNEP